MSISGREQPDISIVIPARNAAATIDATLRSLLPERGLISEILLVDDGSIDQTTAISMQSARRHGLPLEILAVRLGSAGAARNAGIARAKGKFILFLDADDEVMAGGLGLLHDALLRNPEAGLSIGASIRRTRGRPDKLKVPHGYTSDRASNARRYLLNEVWPIAMGSALVAASATATVRFPETTSLDEDTCYWAAMVAQADVTTISSPVLLYHHDEERMARRFVETPRATFLAIALELDKLAGSAIARDVLQWRKAWIALRISRQLIKHNRYSYAMSMMRAVRAHKSLGRSWKASQYRIRIRIGAMMERPDHSSSAGAVTERRTLVVSFDPAFPPVSGADLRNFNNASLAAEFGPVQLASIRPLGDARQPSDSRINAVGLVTDGEPRSASLGWWRIAGENRIPRTALARLRKLMQTFKPDTVIVEGTGLFKLLRHLRPLTKQLVLDMHNVESDLAAQLRHISPARSPAVLGIRRLERKAQSLVDRVWVCSNQDRERLMAASRHKVPIDVVPNGIPNVEDIPRVLPAEAATDSGYPTIVFIGHLGYPPNVDAAERLTGTILPRIRQVLPGARLTLAGRSPKAAVRALTRLPGVALVEDPESVSPLLSGAHLSIIPLRAGGGTRIKILEAMAWGVPVIATPLAAEGLDMVENDQVLLSTSDEGLADMAIELSLDAERRARQRKRAHQAVWARFGPQAIRDAVRAGLALDNDGK
ncbi:MULTISPECIES: glycosyltransferase [unclassified Mesorhizobium]|uniref:glycosyltransferase n=1 Tax=unclassified Mesorhizobium TaxID=325217 RepID=UPI000FCB9E58|nr:MULTISPECIES: glycosyltransferase [unclassified Mesorhizobium]RUW56083.1 glycosyltransferase [Mesorhizobium sp. M8A.F.Ca.ET.021.01.1.1]TGS37759.1 glycosyltransferase [Mesorhizobium sp. M8A.F.Ca.ET.182.01.1.1]TGS76674.1 glycosyltransferase [Mesorhizobium sp. M8A.F.Ca.ET.181.01.1.1]